MLAPLLGAVRADIDSALPPKETALAQAPLRLNLTLNLPAMAR